ncbi:exopolysaccharide biosynthesis protein [Gellertiella hungarica]|uniref:exopolysaccharide biosynthesis protein n=1 Tax=Gellertiella hungarica TaxID=1572859 RepID=UPI00160AE03E
MQTGSAEDIREQNRRDDGTNHRLSETLEALATDESRERISVRDIFEAMGDRAFGALMLVFALPNIIPTPPGTSAVLGAPLVFLTAQLALGLKPWLPGLIADRSMSRLDFAALTERIAPWLAKAERLLKPRLTGLVGHPAEYVVGAICLILAVILTLPIPLGNMLPALSICLFSLAILERDGLFTILGTLMAAVSVVVVGGVVYALVKTLIFLVSSALM